LRVLLRFAVVRRVVRRALPPLEREPDDRELPLDREPLALDVARPAAFFA
jgi:hypothetical protein